jgi:hypothetical protein
MKDRHRGNIAAVPAAVKDTVEMLSQIDAIVEETRLLSCGVECGVIVVR